MLDYITGAPEQALCQLATVVASSIVPGLPGPTGAPRATPLKLLNKGCVLLGFEIEPRLGGLCNSYFSRECKGGCGIQCQEGIW